MPRTKIPAARRKQIVRQYHEGVAAKELCQQYDLSRSTLYTWIYKYPPKQLRHKFTAPSTELRGLQKNVTKLANEVNILQSFLEYKGFTNKDRYEFMDLIYGKFTIHELCGAFNIDRATYYNHLKAKDAYTYRKERDARFDELISRIHDEHRDYGVDRIYLAIKAITDEPVSTVYIRKRMRFLGIESDRFRTSKARFLQWNTRKTNLLLKQFELNSINQVWVADITVCHIKGQRRYISIYEDLFSRRVIAVNVGYGQSTNLVRFGLIKAIRDRNPRPGLILHTDGGAQYSSWTMRRLYAKYRIQHSTSRASMPTDNPFIESFNHTLKADFIKGGDWFHSEIEFREKLDEFVERYNNDRIHTAIGAAPAIFEENLEKQISSSSLEKSSFTDEN